jgi:hypothetical protein
VVCRPKDQGWLGIHDLQAKNTVLLGKWLFKLLTEDGVWRTLLKREHVGSKAISQKPGDSHFWVGLMARKKLFFNYRSFLRRMDLRYNSGRISGLEMPPSGNYTLLLYTIVRNKGDTIATIMTTSLLIVTFRRDLIRPQLLAWNALLHSLASVQLSLGTDEFQWNLQANGFFLRLNVQSERTFVVLIYFDDDNKY